MTTLDPSIRSRLAAIGTPTISDALDQLGLPGATVGLRPLWPYGGTIVGRARTLKAAPRTGAAPQGHIGAALVDDASPGDVIVIDNSGRTDVSCWGGILATGAAQRSIAGVVIDGCCRDIDESEALGLPVFGLGVVPVSARGRIVQISTDQPIVVGGVGVASGDVVVADRCGVAFIAADAVDDVLAIGEQLAQRELAMIADIQAGKAVADVMHDTQFALPRQEPK